MAKEFIMPQLGLTMTEGTIVSWAKSVGDQVALGDVLVEVETEKVNYEVESTLEGELLAILVSEGDVAEVKAAIAVIGQPGEKVEAAAAVTTAAEVVTAVVETTAAPEVVAPVVVSGDGERLKASPIAKRLAREADIDIKDVPGTGPDGRIVERDIQKHLEEKRTKTSPLADKLAAEYDVDLNAIQKDKRIMSEDVLAQVNQQTDDAAVSVEALTGMRKVIAERLSASWQTSPHVNMTAEVDMSKAIDLKAQLAASGQKVSVTDIIVKCTAIALTEFPLVNASLINNEIIKYKHVNIGIAVALDNGLIVPVIKDANHKTISALRNDLLMLSDKARTGRLTSDEMSQGTFTISNLGMYGVDHFTPIINPPQSAILGVCRTVERPVAVDGQVVVKPLMNLCLSFDHRLIDGVDGAKFLARIRALLEQPLLLL